MHTQIQKKDNVHTTILKQIMDHRKSKCTHVNDYTLQNVHYFTPHPVDIVFVLELIIDIMAKFLVFVVVQALPHCILDHCQIQKPIARIKFITWAVGSKVLGL